MTEQQSTPLTPGDIVEARVKHVAVFGIFFEYLEHEILVRIPDVSWIPSFASCEQVAAVGDEFRIKIIHYAKEWNHYVGSILAVHPENDPWGDKWHLRVGDEIEATVFRFVEKADRCGDQQGYLIELRPAVFVMLCGQRNPVWMKGQKCQVTVKHIDVDRRHVVVQLTQ